MERKEIHDAVDIERDRQDAKWGSQRHHTLDRWFTILGEEVGEFGKEINEYSFENGLTNLKEEAIQVAAVIYAILEKIE